MKTDLNTIRDAFRISMNAYLDSAKEAEEVTNMYHNRQYTQSQLAILKNRGQPAETFNVIKLFGRLMLGYYSTVVNTVKVSPNQTEDVPTASLLNDVLTNIMQNNQMETEGDKIKIDGLLAGLMVCYEEVEDTGKKDKFGRPIRKIGLTHVPYAETALDPLSRKEDYSDARYIHRWKWVAEEQLKKLFPGKDKEIATLMAYQNHLLLKDAEFEKQYNKQFWGIFKRYNNYLLVHTIIEDDDGKVWSVHWCAETELSREQVTFSKVRFPYRVHKLQTSDKTEYYGVFREVVESQKAINQALLKIQLMANTQKAFVQTGGVEDITEFTNQFNRVNAVIQVKDLRKIKIENLSSEVRDQYMIIDKGFDRIQKVLGVNDSFLGMAFASDSGRKVKLQQNATTMSLRYVSTRIEQFYRLLGWDIVNLVQQYYTATQAIRMTDENTADRWIQLNQPLQIWNGQFDANKRPIMKTQFEETLDPATHKPLVDDNGNVVISPIPTQETDIHCSDVEITIDTSIYNDEDEKNQLMLETVLSGSVGEALMQVNPAGYFQMAAMSVKIMKTRYSQDISDILKQTAQQIASAKAQVSAGGQQPPQDPNQQQPSVSGKQAKKSKALSINQPTTAREQA